MSDIINQEKHRGGAVENPTGLSVKELAQKTGRSTQVIYRLIKRLGRVPTVEEIQNRSNGRPRKY